LKQGKFYVAAFVYGDTEVTTAGGNIALCQIRSALRVQPEIKMAHLKPEELVPEIADRTYVKISTESAYVMVRMLIQSDVK